MEIDKIAHQLALLVQGGVFGSHLDHASVRQHDFQFADVISGRAIEWSMGPTRIACDHAAQARPSAGGYVGSKAESVRVQESVQLIEDHAGSHAHRAAFQV